MKPKILIIALFLYAGTTWAQKTGQKTLDSLQSCLLTSKSDSAKAEILTNLGTYFMDNGSFPNAINNFLQGMTIFEKLKNDSAIFDCQNRLAICYSHSGDDKTALEYLNKCKPIDIGRLYDNFALIYYNQHNISKALSYWKMSLEFYQNKSDLKKVSKLYNDIGSLYELQKGKIDTAIEYYNKSLKIAQSLNDKQDIFLAYASLGDVNFREKRYGVALSYEEKSLNLAKENNALISMKETEKILSDIYFEMGDCKTSLIHYKNHIALKDSLTDANQIKQITKVEENFRFEKEKSIAKLEQDKKDFAKQQQLLQQRNQKIFFIIGFIIVVIFSIFLFMSYRRTIKQKDIILEQKKIVEHSKKELTDNIHYAKRIQDAVMTPLSVIEENIQNSFVLNMARDTVSGDFLFLERYNNEIIVAVADCTNHSVSGAMMSILCNNLLSEAISNGNTIPSDILNYINVTISKKFHQTDNYNLKEGLDIVKDGMDVIIVKLDLINMKYQYAGAYNPLIIVRDNQTLEIKADKLQLGQTKEKYKNNEGELQKNDMLYMSSDGYADQFSLSGKKFMKKKFKELLISISQKSTNEQKSILEQTICEWKNGCEQTDDILVMGIKI